FCTARIRAMEVAPTGFEHSPAVALAVAQGRSRAADVGVRRAIGVDPTACASSGPRPWPGGGRRYASAGMHSHLGSCKRSRCMRKLLMLLVAVSATLAAAPNDSLLGITLVQSKNGQSLSIP